MTGHVAGQNFCVTSADIGSVAFIKPGVDVKPSTLFSSSLVSVKDRRRLSVELDNNGKSTAGRREEWTTQAPQEEGPQELPVGEALSVRRV